MTELLVLLLVAAAYALGRARDERDRLIRALQARRDSSRVERAHWQPLAHQLEAERAVWQQAASLHRVARRVMQDIVAEVRREPSSIPAPPAATRGTRQSAPSMQPSGLSADDDVHRVLRGARQ